MEVDKLLIVAHPDDEVLWGGLNLLLQPGWFVVCSTHANDPIRSLEFYRTMSYANVAKCKMFDVKDVYTEDPDEADDLYDGSAFDKELKVLAKHNWKLVLTHNAEGEYGHEHHKKVHQLVTKYFSNAKTFKPSKKLSKVATQHKQQLLQFYEHTQNICKKIYRNQSSSLKQSEYDHFFKETVYVTPTRIIPKIIHQIWFGKPLVKNTIRYNLMEGVKTVAEHNGFIYKRWTNAELNETNLPITYALIQESIRIGEQTEQSRFAQVADFARYEFLHRFGGVYLDSLFEIGDKFCAHIFNHRNFEIIVSNEDPCKLQCKGGLGKKYLSNGFFACVPGSIPLKRLLSAPSLKAINLHSKYINQETGPYFFRSGITNADKVHVIETDRIYHFMVNDSDYRSGQPNKCVLNDKLIHDCLHKKYPKSLAVYHSGFGGSWSW